MSNSNRFSDEVLPAVFDRLDTVFPEFGWKRRREGWVATNDRFSHDRLSVRADRIICTEHQGYYIHGAVANEHWLSYINHGHFPRGEEWYRVASELARRVGMADFAMTRTAGSPWRRVLAAAQQQLASDGGVAVRSYCEGRQLPWESWGLGCVADLELLLDVAGLTVAEARRLRVLTSRPGEDWWSGRLVGGIYNVMGDVVGVWGRALGAAADKYVVSGSTAPSVLGKISGRRVVITEGWLDGHRVRSVTGESVIVAGGAQVTDDVLELVRDASEVIVGFDGDEAGEVALRAAVRRLVTWQGPPTTFIGGFGPDEDLDEVLRDRGADGWATLIASATSWLQFAARKELEGRVDAAEVISLRRVGALCRAALPLWPVEVAVTMRETAARHAVDERFLRRVLESVSYETLS